MGRLRRVARSSGAAAAAVILMLRTLPAAGLEDCGRPLAGEAPAESAAPAPPKPARPVRRVVRALGREAGRYGRDSLALVTAPLHWDRGDREKAGGFALILGSLFLADRRLDRGARNNRSRFTDRVSQATTSLGGGDGQKVAFGLLAAGLVFRDDDARDTGREAVEAGAITGVLNKFLLKPGFGRERPETSDGRTVFRFGSSNSSFPSGHATAAFSIASVVAMRSKGWLIPGIAYMAATLVAFDRVNDRAHFPSDVFAGAVFGTATGRFLVSRHRRAEAGQPPKVAFDVVPIRGGLQARLKF